MNTFKITFNFSQPNQTWNFYTEEYKAAIYEYNGENSSYTFKNSDGMFVAEVLSRNIISIVKVD